MIVESADYVVRIISLPATIYAFSVVDEDGRLNIYINDKHTPERQRQAFRHEICHFTRGDFWNFLPIRYIENMAACH